MNMFPTITVTRSKNTRWYDRLLGILKSLAYVVHELFMKEHDVCLLSKGMQCLNSYCNDFEICELFNIRTNGQLIKDFQTMKKTT